MLAWGYLHGVRSSRKLARLARQEAAFVYLAGGGQPNYRTLARFRRKNVAAFMAVFQETVVLARRLGLAQLGHVALDGTKLKANTSKHKAMSYGRMRQREAQLSEEIARLVQLAEVQDVAEDQEYGVDSDGYSVNEELALWERRLAKIRVLWLRLEAEQRAEQGVATDAAPAIDEKEQRSFADGDARIMLMRRGEYAYASNAQAVAAQPANRRDALEDAPARQPPPVRATQSDRGTGVWPAQGGPQLHHVQPARAGASQGRIPAGLRGA